MFANWIHVMLVHVAIIATPWLTYRAIIHRKYPMDSRPWKVNFSALIVLAIITVIAYFTGPETADWVKETLTDYPQDLVEDHALWGRIGMVIQGIAGILGIMGWASIAQEELPDRRIATIVIVLLVINILVLIYTGHLGGQVRRPDLVF